MNNQATTFINEGLNADANKFSRREVKEIFKRQETKGCKPKFYLFIDTDYYGYYSKEERNKDYRTAKKLFTYTEKTAQQRQFEQVTDKFRSLLSQMEETLKLMPVLGNVSADCQRTAIQQELNNLDSCINGISLEDFTPNEYSGDFKLSYS